MRSAAVLLLVLAACPRQEEPEPAREGYGPLQPTTRITVGETSRSGGARPLISERQIRITGAGSVRLDDTVGTYTGRISRGDLVHLLDELASIDFMRIECTNPVPRDRRSVVSLVIPAGTHRVTIDGCQNAALTRVVTDIEAAADRATQDQNR